MRESVHNFRDLRIWQKGVEVVEWVYQATELFPDRETYGLSVQMRRAAVSIPSNIAEGFRRKHAKEYKQFLGVALGSCGELETQVEIAKRLGYLDGRQHERLAEGLDHLCRMTQRLLKKL